MWSSRGGSYVSGSKCHSIQLVILSLICWLFSHHVLAENSVVPATISRAVNVNAEELIDLAENVPNLVIIDSRVAPDRINGYIEGSISLPNTETNCTTLAKVVKTLDAPVVYYCNGPKCGRSAKAIKVALDCGYTKSYWYRGGFEEWKDKNYPYIRNEK